jgi:hypothetical protein
MRNHDLDRQTDTRAVPLPEERTVERGDEDRHAEAEEILADSEERVDAAARAATPANAAAEHRRSEETAG